MRKWLILVPVALLAAGEYESVRRKLDSIERDRLAAGTRVQLTLAELNAYVANEVKEAVPQGVRNPKLELGPDSATGSAWIDFAKLREGQGKASGWLMGKLLEGERPVKVTAAIRSSAGMATVDVRSVEISGMTVEGAMLEFLIDNFVLSRYPEAAIGKPFELGHNIDRLEIRPGGVGVVISR